MKVTKKNILLLTILTTKGIIATKLALEHSMTLVAIVTIVDLAVNYLVYKAYKDDK